MDAYETLQLQAREKFEQAIAQSHADYRAARRQIDALHRLITGHAIGYAPAATRAIMRQPNKPLNEVTTVEAAERLLIELGPMTLVELVVVLRERGIRADEDPRKLSSAIRGAFLYHRKRFKRDGDKRWSVLNDAPSAR